MTRFSLLIVLFTTACWLGGPSGSPDSGLGDSGGPIPFFSDNPNVYVAKVKNVLVGLPPTDAELQTVSNDPSQLGTLVEGWMKMPEYEAKMLRFFQYAFQQAQITGGAYAQQFPVPIFGAPSYCEGYTPSCGPNYFVAQQSATESFARTMLQMARDKTPFTQAMSTQTFMMTTFLKLMYAMTDGFAIDNGGGLRDTFSTANPTLMVYVTGKTVIPISQSVDKNSPNYMHWYLPGLSCPTDPISFKADSGTILGIVLGHAANTYKEGDEPGGPLNACTGQLPLVQPSDFTDWRMTTVRQPKSGEATVNYFDVPALRSTTNDLVLSTPYVGFFTTPSFFANWQTNQSNQMRVTMNQTFIVATGAAVDGTDPTTPSTTPGLDATHAGEQPCYGCHALLDPSRSIFTSTYSYHYGHGYESSAAAAQPGQFAFHGVVTPVKTIYDLGSALASHPLVPAAWAQKLCYYVNSEACDTSDPAFENGQDGIVDKFKSSGLSWNDLVKAVVTSPITTHTTATVTATMNGETVAIARRDHLCAAWNARLHLTDVCGLDLTAPSPLSAASLTIVGGLPSDGYARGATIPVLPNDSTLMYRGATENLCEALAQLLIDNPKAPANAMTWSSANPTQAISDFVSTVAGLPPSDARASDVSNVLTAHFTQAKAATSATAALQSTFVLACLSPSAVSIGM